MESPDPALIWRAIRTYLARAYPEGEPPPPVRSRLDRLRGADPLAPDAPGFEHEPARGPRRHALRLGNSVYPHMKLVIEGRPDGPGFYFRVDTHDRHIGPPPDSAEFPLFLELRTKNAEVARSIEEAWEAEGIPTFRGFLREDVARRQGAAKS